MLTAQLQDGKPKPEDELNANGKQCKLLAV
jgi:hypothetical protein